MQWTNKNPGAGDLEALRVAKSWFVDSSQASDNAYQTIFRAKNSLPSLWTGKGATAFSLSMQYQLQRLTDAKEVADEVAVAFTSYIDEVEEIRESAKTHISDRDTSLPIMNMQYMDSTTNPPDDDELRRRKSVYTNAKTTHDGAVKALEDLGTRRQEADDLFAKTALGSASDAWGIMNGLAARSGFADPKYPGNATAWELFGEFQSGEGPRNRFFTDGDPITEWLRQSDHLDDVRQKFKESLANETLASTGFENRRISDNAGVLLWDMVTAGSGGEIGNLPESMMGSYVMEYVVNSVDKDGNAEVTFTITNPMTRDSFTRIPGTGGDHMPWYDTLNDANAEHGIWADSRQTYVWTETIRKPQ